MEECLIRRRGCEGEGAKEEKEGDVGAGGEGGVVGAVVVGGPAAQDMEKWMAERRGRGEEEKVGGEEGGEEEEK